MYARVQTHSGRTIGDTTIEAAGRDGYVAGYELAQLAGDRSVRLTIWETRAGARAGGQGGSITAGPLRIDDETYEVLLDEAGSTPDARPMFAQLIWTEGPLTTAQAEAAEFAGRHRIAPVARPVPGLVRVYALRRVDNGSVVILLADTVECLEQIQRRVLSTTLLPTEDPALLPQDIRIELHRVAAARFPAPAQ